VVERDVATVKKKILKLEIIKPANTTSLSKSFRQSLTQIGPTLDANLWSCIYWGLCSSLGANLWSSVNEDVET
jgi:hypothetical protein